MEIGLFPGGPTRPSRASSCSADRPDASARLPALARLAGPDARPEPVLAGRGGGRAAAFLPADHGPDVGRGRGGLALRGGRTRGDDGRVPGQPQRSHRGDVWLLGSHLSRPLARQGLATARHSSLRSCSVGRSSHKEEGIGTCAYLAAYALVSTARGGGAAAWLYAYLPAWSLAGTLRSAWGYGVRNMGLYVDPLTDPGAVRMGGGPAGPDAPPRPVDPGPGGAAVPLRPLVSGGFWWGAVLFLVLLLLIRAAAPPHDRLARFWAAGMFFATIPVAATFPMDRLLTFVGLGASGLLAQYLAACSSSEG